MGVSDIELSEFSQFSYFNLPQYLKLLIENDIEVSIKEVSDYYIENPEFYFKNITEINGVKVPTEITNDVNDGVDYQWNLLKKYSSDEYSNVKIIDYTNQNDLNGYAGYAIRLESGEVVIASRRSESPVDDSMDSILEGNKIEPI